MNRHAQAVHALHRPMNTLSELHPAGMRPGRYDSTSTLGTYFGFQPIMLADTELLLLRFLPLVPGSGLCWNTILPLVDPPIDPPMEPPMDPPMDPPLDALLLRVYNFDRTEPRLFALALAAALPSADFLCLWIC